MQDSLPRDLRTAFAELSGGRQVIPRHVINRLAMVTREQLRVSFYLNVENVVESRNISAEAIVFMKSTIAQVRWTSTLDSFGESDDDEQVSLEVWARRQLVSISMSSDGERVNELWLADAASAVWPSRAAIELRYATPDKVLTLVGNRLGVQVWLSS